MLKGLRSKDNYLLTPDGIFHLIGVMVSAAVTFLIMVIIALAPREQNLWFALGISGTILVTTIMFIRYKVKDTHRQNQQRPGNTDS